MEKEQLKDVFLENLLKSSQTEKPGFDFTARVMSDIHQLEAEKGRNPLWTLSNILIAIGGIVTVVLVYFIIAPFLDGYNLFGQNVDPERFNNYFELILSSFQGFITMIEFLKESTLTLIILFVIPVLLVLDRMLKRFSSRTFLFIF